ncbi:hypothetical protein [Pendulispora albinea]|uniref:Uncharacterized protein n=1 Tax=Pendulispora albinea TaxID=2741071 RepID=A0ABZ2M4T2_9BACT
MLTACAGENARTNAPKGPDYRGSESIHAYVSTAEEAPASPSMAPPPAAPRLTAKAPSSDAESSSGGWQAPPPPAPAPLSPNDSPRNAPKPSAEAHTRPGLGTEWGETRSSYVRDVRFVRADRDRPFAVATMNYNDRRGVDALAAHVAGRAPIRDFVAGGGAITVSIRDENGEPLDAVKLGDRTLVIGHPGDRYSIVLMNHTDHRFEAVATVDGLDVINGRPGTLENRGYVLMPFATLTIDGFRQSHDVVAAFRFARVAESYAARTGSARNVGVIGVAFFTEAGDSFEPYTGRELYLRDTAIPFPASDPRFAQPPR